ncbi:GNAT family N-acetyltransferase [Kocuria rhizophila]|uniref:GNAT family N-acetyltransferase n=1 Tax=Kocuria TaxID=57493 RepID=UPI00215034E4|nr:GNAT family N-acetyltransferase [Kocuria rhizophila]MCR4525831.1 GNAT family N-acetyltransferase [Kocuria rhizophila]MCT1916025.1 GNAT family N-acetyltransferase [Kocuria rhizophila]MDA4828348.1 GNAT family N-acetyltransferase [Kocuria rhizophila]WSQ04666.1 GNAT family N-acetyltransferase [Kocuria rhizophila]
MLDHTLAPAAIRELTASEVAAHADELVDLQHAAYRMGAAMIGDDRIPQLSEIPAELMAAELTWHVMVGGVEVVAAATTSRCPGGRRDIERLVVAPSRHRRALARALVRSVSAGATVVATGRDSLPARRLYERLIRALAASGRTLLVHDNLGRRMVQLPHGDSAGLRTLSH